MEADGDWSGELEGHALAVAFSGPSFEATLARAVEGFAQAFVDIHPSVVARRSPFSVVAPTPSGLLLGVLEECLRTQRDGRVAVGLFDVELAEGSLTASIDSVEADHPHVHSGLSPVISWHEVSIEPCPGGGWAGRIVAR